MRRVGQQQENMDILDELKVLHKLATEGRRDHEVSPAAASAQLPK
jgi:hypothetical protein